MSANKVIIVGVSIYAALFAIAVIYFMTMKFTGDAAGKGLAAGYTFIFGTGLLLLIGVILVIVFLFFFGKVTVGWIKFLAFVPLLLPLLVIANEFVDFGSNLPSDEEQRHVLVIDVRSPTSLDNFKVKFRSGSMTSTSDLKFVGESNGQYYYQKSGAIYYYHYAMFMLYYDNVWLGEVDLDLPEIPEVAPYTDWQPYPVEEIELQDTVQIEYRFKVTK